MAIMYPEKPKEFSPNSKEDLMFEALEKLPDSYYVFHSFKIVNVTDNTLYESETDFVIFNPDKGILCIEAKAGNVKYEDGKWMYGSNIEMSHDGPFHQASNNKWKIIKLIKDKGYGDLIEKCKFLHAVWFPSVSKEKFKEISLPPDANLDIMLTSEAIDNIENEISRIFEIELPNKIVTNLGGQDKELLLNNVLAPKFDLISIAEINMNHKNQVFKKMLSEQVALLNYLEEQNNAVINGLAGTGKTVMALEKAKRHSDNNENVLFLCYNKYLRDYLEENYNYANVDFYTIDGLACKLTNKKEPNYELLLETLSDFYDKKIFPYKHVIIDEGQDFGREGLEDILEYLKMIVLDEEINNGSFYMFYDKNQMIQSSKIPDFIENSDCKLTLYKNCRNTINIAKTSIRLLRSDKNIKVKDGTLIGESNDMYYSKSRINTIYILNNLIESLKRQKYKSIQILTCKTEDKSIIRDEIINGYYEYNKEKYPFTTCRKFKGLEAEAVILVDISKEMLLEEMSQLLYVGASRAKYKLIMISNIDENECKEILDEINVNKGKNVFKSLAIALNAKYKTINEELDK